MLTKSGSASRKAGAIPIQLLRQPAESTLVSRALSAASYVRRVDNQQIKRVGSPHMHAEKSDVLHGTLVLMVLKTLDALGPLHGYRISRRLEQISGNQLALNQGTL